jgi:hypothetical protein
MVVGSLPLRIAAGLFLLACTPGVARSAPVGPPAAAPRRAEGEIVFDVRDSSKGELIPCKLTFVGVDGTPGPAFTHNDIGRPEGDGVISAYDRVMSVTGAGAVRVPAGTYDVYVSRGLEWTIAIRRAVKIGVGAEPVRIEARLTHVIDTTGWLSADFHVHAAPSPDSVVPLEHRVIEFVSDGVEMIVSTDHNVISDYQPAIGALGVGRYITTAMGDELTTNGWGHFGAFPLPRNLAAAGHGAVLVHGRNAREIFGDVRKNAPGAIIDVHHPRLDAEVGYFTIGDLDPHSDRAGRPGFSFDFDAVEVLNGYQDPVRRSVDRTIDDWMGLLNHGHIVTATGNSDTHHLNYNIGGYPRNYVRVPDDRPDRIQLAQITAALKEHRAFFTTGPIVRLDVGGLGIGDVAPARGGRATLEIEVRAAPWISVDRVILYVDGKEAQRWRVPAGETVVRFKQAVPLLLARDSYALVRVDGDRLMAPVVGDTKTFGVRPLALTNPIFLDVDGNGRYDPAYGHGSH